MRTAVPFGSAFRFVFGTRNPAITCPNLVAQMRVLLFDWTTSGHHRTYVERIAHVLLADHDVIVAVPDALAIGLESSVDVLPLRNPQPLLDRSRRLSRGVRDAKRAELEIFLAAIAQVGADHVLHLFADALLPLLSRVPDTKTRVSLLLFRPRAHYPRMYGTALSPSQRIAARIYETIVRRWRQRPDAHAVLTLDPAAAERWSMSRGARAIWLPEPYVTHVSPVQEHTADAVLFGSLGPRKGLHFVADALLHTDALSKLIVAGGVEPGYASTLENHVRTIQQSGRSVDLRARVHSESEGLETLADAPIALVPYDQHWGMSRILLEASAVGTSVVATDRGLIGHITRSYPLGAVADVSDPQAFGRVLTLVAGASDAERSRVTAGRAHFLRDYSQDNFAEKLRDWLS